MVDKYPFWFPKTPLVIILCDQVIATMQMNNGDKMSFSISIKGQLFSKKNLPWFEVVF